MIWNRKCRSLLFGLTLPVSEKVKDAVEGEVMRRFPGMQTVCRYSKEGIYQYVSQHTIGKVELIIYSLVKIWKQV